MARRPLASARQRPAVLYDLDEPAVGVELEVGEEDAVFHLGTDPPQLHLRSPIPHEGEALRAVRSPERGRSKPPGFSSLSSYLGRSSSPFPTGDCFPRVGDNMGRVLSNGRAARLRRLWVVTSWGDARQRQPGCVAGP